MHICANLGFNRQNTQLRKAKLVSRKRRLPL
jgi:hypothetical protein